MKSDFCFLTTELKCDKNSQWANLLSTEDHSFISSFMKKAATQEKMI